MSEQEAQQAQTIAEIEAVRDDGDYHRSYYRATVDKALSLIYSQAQKITELSALFQKAGNGAIDLAMKCSEQELKIAEQAKALNDCETRNVKLNQQNDKLRGALAEQAERVKQ